MRFNSRADDNGEGALGEERISVFFGVPKNTYFRTEIILVGHQKNIVFV